MNASITSRQSILLARAHIHSVTCSYSKSSLNYNLFNNHRKKTLSADSKILFNLECKNMHLHNQTNITKSYLISKLKCIMTSVSAKQITQSGMSYASRRSFVDFSNCLSKRLASSSYQSDSIMARCLLCSSATCFGSQPPKERVSTLVVAS